LASKFDEPKPQRPAPVDPPPKIAEPGDPELPNPQPVESLKPADPGFQMRTTGAAKFVHPWRVRLKP
jgi:hypothetical protein